MKIKYLIYEKSVHVMVAMIGEFEDHEESDELRRGVILEPNPDGEDFVENWTFDLNDQDTILNRFSQDGFIVYNVPVEIQTVFVDRK